MSITIQKNTYVGYVKHIADKPNKGGDRMGFILPDDPTLREAASMAREAAGIPSRMPENIMFILPNPLPGKERDGRSFCKGTDPNIEEGDRVSFRVCQDKNKLLQAYEVKILDIEIEYADPALRGLPPIPAAKASVALRAYAAEMPDEDDFEDVFPLEEGETDDEIDQNEVEFSVYYEDN